LGIIAVDTWQGVKNIEIAGDEPTEQELDEISQAFPKLETSAEQETPTENMPPQAQAPVDMQPPQIAAPEITQEIEDKSFRYALGRMETDEEKMNLLTQKLGPGTFERTAEDTFVIDAAKVSPNVRMELGLPDQGLVYADKPGFTSRDLFDFAGESGTPLLGAITAGVMLAGAPILIGMAGVGAAAAAFSAGDEAIDYFQGLNKQSLGDVMAKVAKEGTINALGEGAGRAIVGGVARLIKGPGPKYSQARADELAGSIATSREADSGLQALKNTLYPSPDKLGKQLAQEEAISNMRGLVIAGASPAIGSASGKSILGTAQALSENVMPPSFPGARNSQFIRNILEDVGAGRITQEAGSAAIDAEAKALASTLNAKLVNPDEAFKIARRNLDDVITGQLKALEKNFSPIKGLPTEFSEGLQVSAALFQASSNALYKNADTLLKTSGIKFDLAPVVKQIEALEDKFISLGIPVTESSIFNAVKRIRTEGGADISTLQNLKSVLELAAKDPGVIASQGAAEVGKVIKSLGSVLQNKLVETQKTISQGYKIVPTPGFNELKKAFDLGRITAPEFNEQIALQPVKYGVVRLGPGELDEVKQGLTLWKRANTFYGEGQEKFNNTAVNMILKNVKAKTGGRNLDELSTIIKGGNVANLKTYLNAVTPSENSIARLAQPGTDATILEAKALFEAGDVLAGNQVLKSAGLDEVAGVLPNFVQGMVKEDSYWQTMVDPYIKGLNTLVQQARSGANPAVLRDSIRTDLSRQWLQNAIRESTAGPANATTIDGVALNNAFKGLGTGVQDTLFGTTNAKILRDSLGDAYLLSAKNADDFSRQIGSIGDDGLRIQAETIKNTVDEATEASRTALASVIARGEISSADDIVQAVLKDPKSYEQLVKTVGRDELVKEGGLKDATLRSILKGADFDTLFTSAGQDAVQTGAWGKNFINVLDKQNQKGVLEKILGKETFKGLKKLASDSVRISNADRPSVGFAGSVARLAGGGAILAAVLGHFAVAATAAGSLGGSIIATRLFRQPNFLKILLSPQMRSNLYSQAIKDGLVPEEFAQKTAGNEFGYFVNKFIDSASREALRVTATTAVGQDRESPQGMMLREGMKGQTLPSGLSLDQIRERIKIDPNMFEGEPDRDFRLAPLPIAQPLSMNASEVERERARMGIAGLYS
jgi:hypothetical protein